MKIIIRESLNCVKIGHGFELSSYLYHQKLQSNFKKSFYDFYDTKWQ